jgi:hypothetical protein
MKFYSVKLRKKINIPEKNVTYKKKNGRKFAIGKYKVDGKIYEAWKTVRMKKK